VRSTEPSKGSDYDNGPPDRSLDILQKEYYVVFDYEKRHQVIAHAKHTRIHEGTRYIKGWEIRNRLKGASMGVIQIELIFVQGGRTTVRRGR
jgi:hypothetical protein